MATTEQQSFYEQSFFDTAKRFIQVIPAALAITLLLVLAMERLIYTEPFEVEEVVYHRIPDPVIEIREPDPIVRDRPEKPEPPELVPELPQIDVAIAPNDATGIFEPIKAPSDIKPEYGGYSSDQPIATVLVQPQYPARALSRGIEGYVDVRFDVSASGATTNIRVIRAEPESVFDKEAIKAVKNWKFQPVIIKGEAKPYANMEQRITFQMET